MLADEVDDNANWLQMRKRAQSRSVEIGLD